MPDITPTQLRKNIYKILDDVLNTGVPVEIIRNGKLLKIIPVKEVNKLEQLIHRPDTIIGDSDDLANVHWQNEIHLDLP